MSGFLGKPSRKAFLGAVVVLPVATALPASADASKSSQASMQYQATPKDGKHCAQCNFFIPGNSATADGTCKIVDGSISPNGYCIAFNAVRP